MGMDLKKVCSKRLKDFKPNLTAQDKLDAMSEMDISRVTLDKYLNGKVSNIDLATKLIQFLSTKINGRIADLQDMQLQDAGGQK